MTEYAFILGESFDSENRNQNEPWSNITIKTNAFGGKQYDFNSVGCGCCADWGSVTTEKLDQQILIYEKALLDLKALRLKLDEVTK